jgi:hypothetical protein
VTTEQLPGFPFMERPDGAALDGQCDRFEFQQLALAEYLLSLDDKARKTNNAAFFATAFLQWLQGALMLTGDEGMARFVQFKQAIMQPARLDAFTTQIADVRQALNLPAGKTILCYLYWDDFQAKESEGKRAVWVAKGEKIVRTRDVNRLKNTKAAAEAALAKQLDLETLCLKYRKTLDLETLCLKYRKTRCSLVGDFGAGRKYIMAEIMAVCPSIGNERFAEMCLLFNVLALYSLTENATASDPALDEYERALISELATHLVPSPGVWKEVPLQLLAMTVERAAVTVQEMEAAFLMNDHGHRGGKDHLVTQLAGWVPSQMRPVVILIDNGVTGKSGMSTAKNAVEC